MKKLLPIIVSLLFIIALFKPIVSYSCNSKLNANYSAILSVTKNAAAPVITNFSPKSAFSGAAITITGTDFTGTTAVTFGGVAAQSFFVVSATTINAVVAGQSASGSVVVTSAGGTSSLAGFIFFPPPVITSISPSSAAKGATVTITGTNLSAVNAVAFGGVLANSFQILSSTTVTAVVDGGASGKVYVGATGGSSELSGFTYIPPPPVINDFQFSPAKPGQTVQITGNNFDNATSVTFGGVNAASFTVIDPTVIVATVGAGASGSVSVTTLSGTASKSGFVFTPAPYITSFTPTVAKVGDVVQINGAFFTNISSVNFGGAGTPSFTVISSTSISATVGPASQNGNLSVVGSSGSFSVPGFTVVAVPTITQPALATFTLGNTFNLSTPNISPYTYQWFKDGVAIPLATSNAYGATLSGSYTVTAGYGGVTQTSQPVVLYAVLPDNNFKVAATTATCKGSNNGSISITAVQQGDYTVAVTNSTGSTIYSALLAASATVPNLMPGTYNVCVTANKQPASQQCFAVKVTEPKDLALYTIIDKSTNMVYLALSGADLYYVDVDGVKYTSTTGSLTLALNKGVNNILVTSDKQCQGALQKRIVISDDITAYPNPFTNSLTIDLGSKAIATAVIEIYSSFGKMVYHQQFTNTSGTVSLDLSSLAPSQIYVLKLAADGTEYINKIVKK